MNKTPKKPRLKRFLWQLIISALIFTTFMIPNISNNPAFKDLQHKAKEIVFCEVNHQDIAALFKKFIGKIVTSSGESQNEETTKTYPDA